MKLNFAARLKKFPTYLFDELDNQKDAVRAKGVDVIDLTQGDPIEGSPQAVVEELIRTAQSPANHQYPSFKGVQKFREAASEWLERNFALKIDPDKEVLSVIGTKGGMGHVPLALLNPGDIALLPNPCYAAYPPAVALADGEIYELPLLEENSYLPALEKIPESVAQRARLMIINYPNNPTTGVASLDFFDKLVHFARKYEVAIAHDAPYLKISFDGRLQPSFLQAKGAKHVGVEFHSCSKMFNMTGWRVGFVAGNQHIIAGLGKIKSNIDMGIFFPIQYAAIKAMTACADFTVEMAERYQKRRDIIVDGLSSLGWKVPKPKATFFIWMPVPDGSPSADFALRLLQKTGIALAPGSGFGSNGEGYIRAALTISDEHLTEAIQRIKESGFVYTK